MLDYGDDESNNAADNFKHVINSSKMVVLPTTNNNEKKKKKKKNKIINLKCQHNSIFIFMFVIFNTNIVIFIFQLILQIILTYNRIFLHHYCRLRIMKVYKIDCTSI